MLPSMNSSTKLRIVFSCCPVPNLQQGHSTTQGPPSDPFSHPLHFRALSTLSVSDVMKSRNTALLCAIWPPYRTQERSGDGANLLPSSTSGAELCSRDTAAARARSFDLKCAEYFQLPPSIHPVVSFPLQASEELLSRRSRSLHNNPACSNIFCEDKAPSPRSLSPAPFFRPCSAPSCTNKFFPLVVCFCGKRELVLELFSLLCSCAALLL